MEMSNQQQSVLLLHSVDGRVEGMGSGLDWCVKAENGSPTLLCAIPYHTVLTLSSGER